MIESPILNSLIAEKQAEALHRAILGVLEDHLGPVPPDIIDALKAIQDADRLNALTRFAARCPGLEAFRQKLTP